MLKSDGSLARNIDFDVANFEVHEKTRRKMKSLKLQSMKIGGRLARNARFEAPTYRSRFSGFLLPSPCLVMSFCVAGVALGNILTCLQKCRQSFCVTCAILLQGFQKMNCILGGRHSTLNVSILILRGKRSTLDVSCCVFFANPIVRAASSGGSVQNPSKSVACCDMS